MEISSVEASKKMSYTCTVCNESFSLKCAFVSHLATHFMRTTNICGKCGKYCLPNSNRTWRMVPHVGEKRHECNVCHKRFSGKYSYKRHMASHSSQHQEQEMCIQCISQISSVNGSEANRIKRDLHECKICRKHFSKRRDLNLHMSTHEPQKPYKCSKCDKSFILQSDLKSHVLIHTPRKFHECAVCHGRYSKRGLSWHMLTHKKERT